MQTFYLSNASQQNDLNDVSTALRNVLTNAKIYGVPSQNAIVMRATPDELLLAQKLVNDLDKARPEVVVDVAVLEVNRNKMRQIGIQLPQTVSVSITTPTTATSTSTRPPTTTGTTTTNNNLTLNNIAHLNANDFAVTIGQAQANLLLSDSDTKVLEKSAAARHRWPAGDAQDRFAPSRSPPVRSRTALAARRSAASARSRPSFNTSTSASTST